MEEPPRIEKVTSSRGISLSDAGSILQSFIDTLDNDHDGTTSSHHDKPSSTPAVTATSSTNANTTPRKTRQEIEEEAILKQFDLLAAKPSGLVSDDTHERLKLIRDSILGEVTGKIVLPSSVVKKIGDDVQDATTTNGNSSGENTYWDDENGTNNVKEEEDGQQFINELNEAEEELQRQEDEIKRREAKRAKKEKKSAKKARKEARRESKRRGMEMSDGGGGGSNKRIKLEEDS